jgi:hypothetical protein
MSPKVNSNIHLRDSAVTGGVWDQGVPVCDASYGVHVDGRSYTGKLCGDRGCGCSALQVIKAAIVTKSSTEGELVRLSVPLFPQFS